MEELRGWDTHDVERVLKVCSHDAVYHDITMPPARGVDEIRQFGQGWMKAVPDFHVSVEKFIVQGDEVVNMGTITGTIKGGFFELPATGKRFEVMYCQVATVKKGKIVHFRDHWDSISMARQVGWQPPASQEISYGRKDKTK